MLTLLAAVLAAAPLEAPVTDVTVYSDRARVTRTGRVSLAGTETVVLPALLDRVDPSTIRVEADGAEVVRVDIRRLEPDALPEGEARKLLDQLNALDDRILETQTRKTAYAQQAQSLAQIVPTVPQGDPLKPPPRLESGGWGQAMDFVAQSMERAQARDRELTLQLEELARQRQELAEKARLLGGAARRSGYEVVTTLSGKGRATVRMTYVAGPARWYPTYDLQLSPEKGQVEVAFAGLVSQETGEDWEGAKITLSTAVPATAQTVPELQSWKIGERDRFIPTPRPKPQPLRPAPTAPPLPVVTKDVDVLRSRLYAAAGRSTGETLGLGNYVGTGPGGGGRGVGYGAQGGLAYSSPGRAATRAPSAPAPRPERKASAPPPMPSSRSRADVPAMPQATAQVEADFSGLALSGKSRAPQPVSAFSLAPPPGYQPPRYSPELPASLAGGYDLSFDSVRTETIRSGKGARRVALFAQSWPVEVERKLFPALAPDAYLVAELKSPSPTPLPGGNAHLYVGADPAGTARLDLVSPGETFTLPLGLDRALKPIRNVELVTAERGFIGTDEVNTYVVRTELANPYSRPVKVKIFDQWPVTDDDDVEIKLLSTKPYAIQDPVKGQLEWHLTLKPRSKTTLSFSYSIRRPKNWRLHQSQ